MSEHALLLDELRRTHDGDPWHGPSRAHVLADIDAGLAARQPPGGAHSIWELVLHMRAWTGEVARRLVEGRPRLPDDGDWPPVPSPPTAEALVVTLMSLNEAHARLMRTVEAFPEERLGEDVGDTRDGPLGTGVTFAAMLHGLAQHDAYHTGQIAILKRLVGG